MPKTQIDLLSFNMQLGKLEFQPIERGHRRWGKSLKLTTSDGLELIADPLHPICTVDRGFLPLKDLKSGDRLVWINKTRSESLPLAGVIAQADGIAVVADYGDEWDQVILGSVLGDGSVYRRGTSNAYFTERHCMEQADYLNWKRKIIGQRLRTRDAVNPRSGYTGDLQIGFYTGNSPILNTYATFKKTFEGVERLGPLGLAVWYMDDGCKGNQLCFSSEGFTLEQNEYLVDVLRRRFKIESHVASYPKNGKRYYCIHGGIEAKRRLVEICAKYIHPSMAYKFSLERNKKNCVWCGDEHWLYKTGTNSVTCGAPLCRALQTKRIKSTRVVSVEDAGKRWLYDFTVAGNHNFLTNGLLSKNCIDELDVLPNAAAYEEAGSIPAPRGDIMPVTLLTSTRKFSFGFVQKEIDKAVDKRGRQVLQIRHWNILDVTQRCKPNRYQPEKGRTVIYRSDDNLQSISEEEYKILGPQEQALYVQDEGHHGCLHNCTLFAACQGRLIDKQTSVSNLLKPIQHVENQFDRHSIDYIKAQILCWKPSTTGLVYPRLDRAKHLITASQMAEMLMGESRGEVNKAQLVEMFRGRGCKFVAGMDFGFSHYFAVVTAALDGSRCFIFDVIGLANIEVPEKIEICKEKILQYNPDIWPDMSDPESIKMFKRAGFRMRNWNKGPGTVLGGIEIVRTKLAPFRGKPELFILAGDPQCEALYKELSEYHWATDIAGEPTDKPVKKDDDLCDACRYMVQNNYRVRGRLVAPTDKPIPAQQNDQPVDLSANWMREVVDGCTNSSSPLGDPNGGVDNGEDGNRRGRHGGLSWSMT